MSGLVDRILNLNPTLVYIAVAALVFAEDALFVGFVVPGETAAVLGGVVASRGHVHLWLIAVLVVAAAIVGDSVGYEVGRLVGPRILQLRVFDQRRKRLDDAQELLRRRGGAAVFFGRFVAFLRAVMPALAGTSRMRYRRFLALNAAGGPTPAASEHDRTPATGTSGSRKEFRRARRRAKAHPPQRPRSTGLHTTTPGSATGNPMSRRCTHPPGRTRSEPHWV